LVNATLLNGRRVVTSDAYVVGETTGVEIDTEKWIVTHLRVSLTGDSVKNLHFKKPFLGDVVICILVSAVNAIGDVISLNIPFSDVASLSECQQNP
jgi:sporulation protein YlmC with PRC-barrel domain